MEEKVDRGYRSDSQSLSDFREKFVGFQPRRKYLRYFHAFQPIHRTRATSRKMRIGRRSRVRLVSTKEIGARKSLERYRAITMMKKDRERERRLTRSSSYRLLGALESPSNDPLFRALCYQPFREEHRGRWSLVLLHGANERSAASRLDRDKRNRALTRRRRTIAFRSMFLHDVDTSYVEYTYMACDVVRCVVRPLSVPLSISADEPFPSIVSFSSSERRTRHRGCSHAIEIEYYGRTSVRGEGGSLG